ncbi:MAG TPA: hypothetical protein VGM23_00025 [Armatimonadota bacterium]|jgi:hypothetical protein
MSFEAIALMSVAWAVILGVTIFCFVRIGLDQVHARRAAERLPDLGLDATR